MSFNRPSWDEYFSTIAELTSQRSNCIKRKVGCIIVKNNRILYLPLFLSNNDKHSIIFLV